MSNLLSQLQSYGDQLEEMTPPYEFDGGTGGGRSMPWAAVVGIAASILLVVGVFVWAQGRSEEPQSLEIISQPEATVEVESVDQAPIEPETTDQQPTSEEANETDSGVSQSATSDAEAFMPDECEGLNPSMAPLVTARPAMRVLVGDVEADVGTLPAQLEPARYSTNVLGVALSFDAGECVTLMEENPGMLTFVAASDGLSDSSPWMSVLVPAALSTTGGASFADAQLATRTIDTWAADVDGVDARRLGAVQVGGVSGTEWELMVNTDSIHPFFCSRGQCASVVRPQVTWWGTFRRPTLSHLPGFMHIDSLSTTRIIELEVSGTKVWIWRQIPPDDDKFLAKSQRWLNGWEFGESVGLPVNAGAFGPLSVGRTALAPGATVNVIEDGWTTLTNSSGRTVLVPPTSATIETPTQIVQILRATTPGFEPLGTQETIDGFAELQGLAGWSLTDPSDGQIGDFVSTVIEIERFGPSNGIGMQLFTMGTGRLHIIESGDTAWMVLIGVSTSEVDALDTLEQQAGTLLIGASLPDVLSDP